MPGPSWSPIFAAVGGFLLFYGLVLHGWLLFAGIAVLVLALIYWLREAIREYDHVEHPQTALVPVVSQTPPPGLHVPGPSFRPILVSIAMASVFFALVFGGWLYLAAFLMFVIATLQWLIDARREYKGVVLADSTGHLPADPRPHYPVATLITFAVLFFGAVFLNAGILPPKAGAAPGASPAPGSPAPGATAAPSPGGTGAPGPGGSAAAADVTITAQNIEFTTTSLTAPANKPFTINFENEDAGTPHNVSIRQGGPTGTELFKGDIFPGVASHVYNVTTLLAPGTYSFVCDVHPTMQGELTVK
jgi:plastocyanin